MSEVLSLAAIPTEYIKNTCKIGQGNECCRYLAAGAEGFECLQHTNLREELDQRAEAKTMVAQAINCSGWSLDYWKSL